MVLQYLPVISAATPVLLAEYGLTKGKFAMSTLPTTTAVQLPPAGDYRIDKANSAIEFRTRHLFGLAPVRGRCQLRDGRIHVADDLPESTVDATVATASFHTGNPARDNTVRSAAYLDAQRHPDITFESTGVDDSTWTLRGRLTVCGTTKECTLTIETSRFDNGHLRIVATTVVDRYEFGITKMKGMAARRLALRLTIVANRT